MKPIEQLLKLHEEAENKNDPAANLCFLSTVDSHDHPHVRTIELMDIKKESLVIVMDKQSPKRKQLDEKRFYELLFFWHTVNSQIRIRGDYKEMYPKTVKEYWNKKDHALKILDVYHHRFKEQSKTILSKEKFNERIIKLQEEFPEGSDIEMPENVTGYFLIPNKIEFWRLKDDKSLPERNLYTFTGLNWIHKHLVP